IMLAVISIPQLIKAWHYDPKAPENIAYYGVPVQTKLEYGVFYLALTGFLAVMTYELHEMLGSAGRVRVAAIGALGRRVRCARLRRAPHTSAEQNQNPPALKLNRCVTS